MNASDRRFATRVTGSRIGFTTFVLLIGMYPIAMTGTLFVLGAGRRPSKSSDNLSKLKQWLERCSGFIPGKLDVKQPNLFPPFCGLNGDSGFRAILVQEDRITRTLNNSDVAKVQRIPNWNVRVDAAVELYSPQVDFLYKHRNVDVVVCVIPDDLYDRVVRDEDTIPEQETLDETEEEGQKDFLETNFRRALKAKTMTFRQAVPLQLIRERSLSPKGKELISIL